jgi:peptidoglycan hydrolase-like protein with peptidoglycan-binding domain
LACCRPYEYLCYTSLKRLKTLRPSSTRTYSYDALTFQNALVYLDSPPVPIKMDGWYGPATASAVKAFQQSRDPHVDGVVGAQTWRKLRSEIC